MSKSGYVRWLLNDLLIFIPEVVNTVIWNYLPLPTHPCSTEIKYGERKEYMYGVTLRNLHVVSYHHEFILTLRRPDIDNPAKKGRVYTTYKITITERGKREKEHVYSSVACNFNYEKTSFRAIFVNNDSRTISVPHNRFAVFGW